MIKTHKGAAKRFRITKKKKVMHVPAGISHFNAKKVGPAKRAHATKAQSMTERKNLKRMLPGQL